MIATHAPIDCITALQKKHSKRFADPYDIRRIDLEQPKAALAHEGQSIGRPITTTGAQMRIRYVGVIQLLDREVLSEPFDASDLDFNKIEDLASKVKCV